MPNKFQLVKEAIELYTGCDVASVMIHPDPKVDDAYAVRALMPDGSAQEYVISCRPDGQRHTEPSSMMDCLEEAAFETWPPPSGNPRFFL